MMNRGTINSGKAETAEGSGKDLRHCNSLIFKGFVATCRRCRRTLRYAAHYVTGKNSTREPGRRRRNLTFISYILIFFYFFLPFGINHAHVLDFTGIYVLPKGMPKVYQMPKPLSANHVVMGLLLLLGKMAPVFIDYFSFFWRET